MIIIHVLTDSREPGVFPAKVMQTDLVFSIKPGPGKQPTYEQVKAALLTELGSTDDRDLREELFVSIARIRSVPHTEQSKLNTLQGLLETSNVWSVEPLLPER